MPHSQDNCMTLAWEERIWTMKQWTHKMKAMGYAVANRPFFPAPLLTPRPLILHISDTPREIYPYLYRVIQKLQPIEIIHTGDMADNYKIELQDFHLPHYQQAVSGFLQHVKKICNAGIHIAMGNHDDLETLKALCPGKRFDDRMVELYGKNFFLLHNLEEEPVEEGYYCFGHNFKPATDVEGPCKLLNGLLTINVIDVGDWTVHHINYPLGTDAFRKMTSGRIKL